MSDACALYQLRAYSRRVAMLGASFRHRVELGFQSRGEIEKKGRGWIGQRGGEIDRVHWVEERRWG